MVGRSEFDDGTVARDRLHQTPHAIRSLNDGHAPSSRAETRDGESTHAGTDDQEGRTIVGVAGDTRGKKIKTHRVKNVF